MPGNCFECGAQTQPGLIQCDKCADQLRRELDSIRTLYGFLTARLDPSVRLGVQGHTHSQLTASPANVNLNVMDLIDGRENGLRVTLRDYAHDLGLEWRQDIPQLLTAIRNAPNLQSSMNTQWYREPIRSLAKRVRKMTTPPPPPSRLVGYCPNPLCGAMILINDLPYSQTSIQCPSCPCVWDVNAIREHNIELLDAKTLDDEEYTLQAIDCSRKLKELTGIHIPATTIRSWHDRGMLQPVSSSRPLRYRVIDVWRLRQRDNRKQTETEPVRRRGLSIISSNKW